MPNGVLTMEQLEEVVSAYSKFDEFTVDVETMGPHRGNPHRNDVFWISLAGPGRADAIPCGHPLGERIIRDPDNPYYRVDPRTGKHQEHQVNETTGRLKWVNVPEPFEDPPKQLWVSDVTDALRPLFFSERRKIGQNVKFDLLSLTKYFGEVPPPPYGDTLIAAKLINENEYQYDLGSLVKRAFKYEYEKIGRKGPDQFPYSDAHLYSYLDAKYTWLLWVLYQEQMEREGIRHVFDLEMDLLPVILDMELTGTPIDEVELAKLGDEFKMEMARIQVHLDDVWQEAGHEPPFNPNANLQKAELVYDILGKPCKVYTETGQRSTKAEVLEDFSKNPIVAELLDYAKLAKLQGTFIEGITDKLQDGRVHPSFNQAPAGDRGQMAGGTVSGRLSCSSPNLQQIPSRSERGKRVRDVFVASPGHVLIVSDLSQIELRMLAHLTQDKVLLQAYRRGDDLHSILAERVFGPDFTPLQRSLAKNGNFSVLYGAQASTLVRRYGFPTEKLAKQVLEGFYSTYRSVEPWKERVLAEARDRKVKRTRTPAYVETIFGRKRRLPELWSVTRSKRMAAERQAISTVVSGSAADLFKEIMVDCHARLGEQEWEGHILMTIHDELVVEVPEEYADEALELVRVSMEDVTNPFTGEPVLTVPIVADGKIVDRWSSAK